MVSRSYHMAAVTSHPVQYQAPLFRQMAAHDDIDLTVFYGHDGSVAGEVDPDFGLWVRWDTPLLDGYRFVFLQRRSDKLNALQRLVADARIIAHLRRGHFDAVFIHSYATRLSFFAYLGALASRTPVLLRTESERLHPRPWWVEALKQLALRPLFALTAGFLVIGKANRDLFKGYGVDPSRQFFTPYAVDNTYFSHQRQLARSSRRALRQSHGWTDDVLIVGFSGKLIPLKRVEDLVDAIANLQNEGVSAGLLMIGDGPSRTELEERVCARNMKWTVFAGFKNQSELAASYICMDAFVLPSRSETWGLVLNEAMLFGLPVLATKMVGASKDLIEHGKNSYVFDVGDVGGLTGHLRRLASSATTRRLFGAHSETIVRRYTYDSCVRGVLDGLRHLSNRSRTGTRTAAHDPRER